ncbi:MAG: hypothetical protein FWD34_04320, partial [Oscillospiraceae bacterium]|nr:hypothetical protein [Oscillospiraceae bacterium]
MNIRLNTRKTLALFLTLTMITGVLLGFPTPTMTAAASSGDCPVHDRAGTVEKLVWAPTINSSTTVGSTSGWLGGVAPPIAGGTTIGGGLGIVSNSG